MGNMPSKWLGRGTALGVAAVMAVGGYFLGGLIGERLARGFTFDWYVHEVHARYEMGEVLAAVSGMTAGAALLSLIILSGLTAFLTRKLAKRMGYAPPRLRDPESVDVHAGRLGLLLGQTGVLVALILYVYFSYPVTFSGGIDVAEPYGDLSANGYMLLMAWGGAFGAFVGAFLTVLSTYAGVVSGKIAEHAKQNLLAKISLFGMRNAKTTVAAVLAVTLLAGYAASAVTTNVDVADVMPRGDPNTAAAKNLTSTFKSSFTQAVTWQFRAIDVNNSTQMDLYRSENAEKLPNRIDAGGFAEQQPANITDELYIRAMAEVIEYVTSQEPFTGSTGVPDFFKLINWTIAGGNNDTQRRFLGTLGDEPFELPPTSEAGEMQYLAVHQGVFNVGAVYDAVDAVVSPQWTQTAILVTVDPKSEVDSRTIGQRAFEVRDEWVERVERGLTEYKIFGPDNPPMFTYDLPLANAHASELTQKDFKFLLPIIGVFIALTLFIAFRSVANVAVTFSSLAIAVTWTFGVMGLLDIPLNTINLAVVPLIMGVGIDYSIHMMNEYQEFRGKGKSPEEAWTEAGQGSAFALFVGALTTTAGLTVMVISPSLLVAQLGFLGVVAIVSTYILAVLFIPAAVALFGRDKADARRVTKYQPSRIMPALAASVSRARILVVIIVLLLAGAAIASAQNLRMEAFGDPPRNWLEDDEHRLEHEEALRGFYNSETDDIKANILIIEGDITDPAVHDYVRGLTLTLRANAENGTYTAPNGTQVQSRVIADTLKDLPFLLNTYLTVRNGVPGAGAFLGGGALGPLLGNLPTGGDPTGATRPATQQYPSTTAEIRALLDEVYGSPLAQFANLFTDHPTYEMTVILFSVKALTYEDAEAAWNEVQVAIAANEALRPDGVKTSYFGNTAINYLFVAKQVPWLQAMNTVTIILITIIVFSFTRKILPTLVVAGVSFLTSTLWFGILPTEYVDIGLAINLTLPLVFITAMGSDYALHLALRCQRSGDTYETFASVGKGVLFSFVTTIGAFLVFTQISDYSGRRSIIGTVLAIATVFVVSLLVVPVFFPVKKGQGGDHARPVPIVETRRERAPQPIRSVPVEPLAQKSRPENGGRLVMTTDAPQAKPGGGESRRDEE